MMTLSMSTILTLIVQAHFRVGELAMSGQPEGPNSPLIGRDSYQEGTKISWQLSKKSRATQLGSEGPGMPEGQYSRVTELGSEGPGMLGTNLYAFQSVPTNSLKTNELIVQFLNYEMVPLLMNYLSSVAAVGVSTPTALLAVALDKETFQMLDDLHVPAWYPEHLFKGNSTRNAYQEFNSPGANKLERDRLIGILELLRSGYNLFVNDVDLVWLRDPFPRFLRSNSSMQIGGVEFGHFNAGYYHVVAGQINTDVFTETLECANLGTLDQTCLNKALSKQKKDKTVLEFLEPEEYPASGCTFRKLTESQKKEAYLFHATCVVGMENKINFMCENSALRLGALFPAQIGHKDCPQAAKMWKSANALSVIGEKSKGAQSLQAVLEALKY